MLCGEIIGVECQDRAYQVGEYGSLKQKEVLVVTTGLLAVTYVRFVGA
jgi:hypothetical protein